MEKTKQYWLDAERWEKCLTEVFKDTSAYQEHPEMVEDYLEEYAAVLAYKHQEQMDKYLHSDDKDIPGNLMQIDLNFGWEYGKEHNITFDEMLRRTDNGELSAEELVALQDWTETWWFEAFGTFGLQYNFNDTCWECFIVEEELEDAV